MLANLILMAPQQGQNGTSQLISTLIMFAAIFGIFYFMIIKPQQKKAKEHQNMIDNIQKGDKVVLSSGIHGKIANIEEKTFLVEIDNNVKIKVEKSSVIAVIKNKD